MIYCRFSSVPSCFFGLTRCDHKWSSTRGCFVRMGSYFDADSMEQLAENRSKSYTSHCELSLRLCAYSTHGAFRRYLLNGGRRKNSYRTQITQPATTRIYLVTKIDLFNSFADGACINTQHNGWRTGISQTSLKLIRWDVPFIRRPETALCAC